MARVENPPPDRSPENKPSEFYKPNTNGNSSFERHAHSKAMENCIALFLKFGATASPTTTLSQNQKSLIEKRLLDSFLVHQRPDHLPYAAMIITAIEKLNEKGGSSDEAISQFIRRENHELPWAHDTFVKHHLDLLLKEGSVFKTAHGLYTTDAADRVSTDADLYIPTSDSDDSSSQSPKQKRKLGKGRSLRIKVETKRGRPRKMDTSKVKQESEKNEKKKAKTGRPRKMKIPTSDSDDSSSQSPKQKRKLGKGRSLQIKVETKRGRPRKMNTSKVKQKSEKNEEKKAKTGRPRKMKKEKKYQKNQESEKSKETELTLVSSRNQTIDEDRVEIGSELQPSEDKEAEAHEKQVDQLTGLKDTIMVNKTNYQVVEETNQLQEHDLAPVKEQWHVYTREGHKAHTKFAGTSGKGRKKRLMS